VDHNVAERLFQLMKHILAADPNTLKGAADHCSTVQHGVFTAHGQPHMPSLQRLMQVDKGLPSGKGDYEKDTVGVWRSRNSSQIYITLQIIPERIQKISLCLNT
jgi:hypothetical protein